MLQEPGPRGSPQLPHGPLAGAAARDFSAPTAKLDNCWLSRLLSHLGQAAFCLPITMASNWWLHCWQMYSKIGILRARLK
jgi:hypothetical protein